MRITEKRTTEVTIGYFCDMCSSKVDSVDIFSHCEYDDLGCLVTEYNVDLCNECCIRVLDFIRICGGKVDEKQIKYDNY